MPAHPRVMQVLAEDVRLVQIVDRAFAETSAKSGAHLACRPGCTQCCHGAFAINALDALRLRAGMRSLHAEKPALAAAVEARAIAYLDEFCADFPGDSATGILGESEEAQAAFDDFANHAPCPALNPDSGLCDVYASRPMTCRVFGPPVRSEDGLAVCELCFTTAAPEEIASCEMALPHDEEERLLAVVHEQGAVRGQTIVAFCLLPPDGTTAS